MRSEADGPVVDRVPAQKLRRVKRIAPALRSMAVWSLYVSALVLAAAAQTAQGQTPMFSRAYGDALQGVLQLEPGDITALEQELRQNPEDFAARLQLIAWCMRADRVHLPESRSRRAGLVLWLVEHHPESEILGSPYGVLSRGDLTDGEWTRARRQWEAATGPGQADARVFWNAANFYRQMDRSSYIASLERAVLLDPANEHYALPLGLLYGGAILSSGADPEFARRAGEILNTTQNPYILEPAVRLLQSEYNASLMRGAASAAAGALAQRYFERAKALDPGLDQAWIYPQIDLKMAGMLAPGARPADEGRLDFEAAAKQIRRLPVDAFSGLPATIREQLRKRGCLIPQQTFSDPAPDRQNAVQGEFFEKGKPAWAVLCSVNESSSILVFRNVADDAPEELAASEDRNQLQGAGNGRIAYSREIRPVDRAFIMEHYRGFGGPEPPPIDHQGIDDAFTGKASAVYYWYRGGWRKLQGAD
jgi:hypothetical protein